MNDASVRRTYKDAVAFADHCTTQWKRHHAFGIWEKCTQSERQKWRNRHQATLKSTEEKKTAAAARKAQRGLLSTQLGTVGINETMDDSGEEGAGESVHMTATDDQDEAAEVALGNSAPNVRPNDIVTDPPAHTTYVEKSTRGRAPHEALCPHTAAVTVAEITASQVADAADAEALLTVAEKAATNTTRSGGRLRGVPQPTRRSRRLVLARATGSNTESRSLPFPLCEPVYQP